MGQQCPDPYIGSIHLDDPDSWNRYAYVGNDPVNNIDPNGTYCADGGNDFCSSFSCPMYSSIYNPAYAYGGADYIGCSVMSGYGGGYGGGGTGGGGTTYMELINAGINGLDQLINNNYQCYMFINNIAYGVGSTVGNVMSAIVSNPVNIITHAGSSPVWGPDAWATVNMQSDGMEIDIWNVGSIGNYTIQQISQGLLGEMIHRATNSYDIQIASALGFQYSGSANDPVNILAAGYYWHDLLEGTCHY